MCVCEQHECARELCWGPSPTPGRCPLSFVGHRSRRSCAVCRVGPAPSSPRRECRVGSPHSIRGNFPFPLSPFPIPPCAVTWLQFGSNKEQKPHGSAPSPAAAELSPGPLSVGNHLQQPREPLWLHPEPVARLSLGTDGLCGVSAPQDKQHNPNAPNFKDGAWQGAAASSQALVLRYKISSVPLSKTLAGLPG